MEKNKKKLLQLIPGIGAKVINENLSAAIRLWKSELKMSGKLNELTDRKYFNTPSKKRREVVEKAKFRQKNQKSF